MPLISDVFWSTPPKPKRVTLSPEKKKDEQLSQGPLRTARSSYANKAGGDSRPEPAYKRASGFAALPRATAAQPQITARAADPSALPRGKRGDAERSPRHSESRTWVAHTWELPLRSCLVLPAAAMARMSAAHRIHL